MIDANYRRAMIGAQQDVGLFLLDLVSHPISFVLTLALLVMLGSQLPFVKNRSRKKRI